MTTPLTAILFDLDNTLFDREAAFRGLAEDFFDERLLGVTSLPRADAVALMVAWDDDGYSDRREMRERWLAEWPDAGLDLDAFNGWYRQVMARHSLPDAAVNDFLARLNAEGMPWGIVTNGNGRNQRSKCREAGLEVLTHFIIVSEEQGYAKPDQRIYRDAMSALGLASPDEVLFVGDNPVTDIDGARAFGMRTAWVSRGKQFPTELRPPDHVVENVLDLAAVLGL